MSEQESGPFDGEIKRLEKILSDALHIKEEADKVIGDTVRKLGELAAYTTVIRQFTKKEEVNVK